MDKRETALVAFLDILGYKDVVKAHIEDFDLILEVENLLKKGAGMMSKNIPMSATEYEDYRDKIIDLYRARIISDSVIFTMQVSKIKPDDRFKDNNENISNYIWMYFKAISMFCPFFIGKTGHVLRGGVSIGSHYENDEGGHLFIYSPAFVEAVEIEKKEANFARIVIGQDVIKYLKSISFPYMEEFFYEDEDKKICFEQYSFFQYAEDEKKILKNIKEAVSMNGRANRNDNRVLEILRYFVRYHNKKISEAGDVFKEFAISDSVFEKY